MTVPFPLAACSEAFRQGDSHRQLNSNVCPELNPSLLRPCKCFSIFQEFLSTYCSETQFGLNRSRSRSNVDMSLDQKEEHEGSYYLVGESATAILKTIQALEGSRIAYPETVKARTLRPCVCSQQGRCQGLIERMISRQIPGLFDVGP